MPTRLILILLALTTISGCYHDNEEALTPCAVPAGSVTYNSVRALLTGYGCFGCHAGAAPEGGITLDQYTALKRVVDNGRFMGAITHATGFKPMPQGGAKMNECDINRIKAWIDAGAHDH